MATDKIKLEEIILKAASVGPYGKFLGDPGLDVLMAARRYGRGNQK